MSRPQSILELEDWPLPPARPASSFSGSTQSSGSASLISSPLLPAPLSPITSSPGSWSRHTHASCYDNLVRLPLHPAVTVSFVRNSKLFRLRYTYIDIRKDSGGSLKGLELGGGVGQQSAFIHTFQTTKLPVPHLENPKLPNEPALRISFLEEQTVQTAHTVFVTQLSYAFEDWGDCVQFQELILASKLVFIAGIAEAKSRGRGEECISQNVRILRAPNGKQVLLFFANSQRRELKRYVSIPRKPSGSVFVILVLTGPVNCIESVNPGKKAGRPVVVQLLPNFDILAMMRTLQIQFLDDEDRLAFCQFLVDHTR
ncbi:hypothetical protein FE257_005143 [Aspergillus nanangensis]|uniref:Uncharacterized protein n=1 Tax=Aspergillus nanangensis TaxID=2582783 RepID=A0AAD4CAC7_ASPNN|nr:hypothetical protein FE257_005143 [Aspergillus nanangensis]